jgi:predicted amidohydrolase
LLIVSTAWGHKYPPLEHWKGLSFETCLPVWVCNRTGTERGIDWTQAESMVLKGGEPLLRYSGEDSVLLFDWAMERMDLESSNFEVISVGSI